jgi:hypothetical protein
VEPRIYEIQRMRNPIAILDLEDRMLRERQGGATHPRPFGRLTVALIARMLPDGTRQPLDPALQLILKRSSSGYLLFFGLIQLAGGAKRRVRLAAGRYVARVESEYYLTAYRDDLDLPRSATAYFFDLEANPFHPLNR